MFTNRELTRLAACKAGLLARSAANRGEMIEAVGHLRRETAWIEAGYNLILKARSAAAVATTVAGLLSSLRGHGWTAWIARVTSAVRLFRRLKPLWGARETTRESHVADGI